MTKVVINSCYGGFNISRKAEVEYWKRKGYNPVYMRYYNGVQEVCSEREYRSSGGDGILSAGRWYYYSFAFDNKDGSEHLPGQIERDDPVLVELVETMGEEVNGFAADLKVVEIPDDVDWEVEEYDGNEWIAEKHRTWD